MKKLSNIQEVQSHLFRMLDAFAAFCDENHLTYLLAYGTLLGAVRHHSFIPWDDDVDVFVPRPDYEKLLEYARSGKKIRNYKFEIFDSEPKYLYPFCKLVDTNTIMKERIADPWPMGLFLDVFPLDGVPDNEMKGNKIIRHLNWYFTLLNCTIWKPGETDSRTTRILFSLGTAIPKLFSRHIRRTYPQKIDRLAKTWDYDSCNYVSPLVWGSLGLKKDIYKKGDLFPVKELEVNGRMFKVPNNYEYLLRDYYGDYMQLPPENERISHIAEIYDLSE